MLLLYGGGEQRGRRGGTAARRGYFDCHRLGPHRAPEIPFDDQVIFDSDSILKMGRIPRSLAVVGGGVIGCEYASIFTALGVEVALVDGRDRVLPFLDRGIVDGAARPVRRARA